MSKRMDGQRYVAIGQIGENIVCKVANCVTNMASVISSARTVTNICGKLW